MLVDLTKLDECCFPAVHSIGSRGLDMYDVFYVNVPDIHRLASLEFACRVDAELKKLVYSMLGENLKHVELDAKCLLQVEKCLHDKVEGIMEDYCDGVYVGVLDNGDAVDDIVNAVDRYTQMLLGGFCAGLRYTFAGAYAVSLCKVNSAESYVIRLDGMGDDFDRTNPRKVAQSHTWGGSFQMDAGFTFLWLGRRVRFENVVHIDLQKGE